MGFGHWDATGHSVAGKLNPGETLLDDRLGTMQDVQFVAAHIALRGSCFGEFVRSPQEKARGTSEPGFPF
jgi:hypothetical protein